MKCTSRSYVLLLEMLLAILFFSVSAAVLLQLFLQAESESRRTALRSEALIYAQSMMEEAAADGEERSVLLGSDGDEYQVFVHVEETPSGAGVLRRISASAFDEEGEPIFSGPFETAVFVEETP